mmetsp:Transcript_11894/g.32980  ORF Transcript_11894/g.32980 Transcript_11894/m.32980 type:complete len:482 (+) Transcript_11894:562-2007(+)
MTSTGPLQHALKSLDGSAPSIKNAASNMMKHYDQTALVAVTEWRNVLFASRSGNHMMSLLYVANEVLQISKRNRGNKFLEAFSAVLGQSLQHICRHDGALTEKVRRTVKIWGDRSVFSVRFVNELLKGLEPFRNGGKATATSQRRAAPTTTASRPAVPPSNTTNLPSSTPTFQDDEDGATFSPTQQTIPAAAAAAAQSPDVVPAESKRVDEDSIMDILDREDHDEEEEDDEDDEDNIFGSDSKLKIDIDLDQVNDATTAAAKPGTVKRRRSSGTGDGKRRRRNSAAVTLSANSLLELSNRVANSQDEMEDSQRALQRIDKALTKTSTDDLEQMVGDELQMEYRQILRFQKQIQTERRRLHGIAQDRRGWEQQAVVYLPWLEKALQQDQDDLEFCKNLEQQLEAFRPIHQELVKARDLRREEEQERLEKKAEQERLRREKEEAERFRQESLRRQTDQDTGMVWNPTTREYQTLNTEESWRDH